MGGQVRLSLLPVLYALAGVLAPGVRGQECTDRASSKYMCTEGDNRAGRHEILRLLGIPENYRYMHHRILRRDRFSLFSLNKGTDIKPRCSGIFPMQRWMDFSTRFN